MRGKLGAALALMGAFGVGRAGSAGAEVAHCNVPVIRAAHSEAKGGPTIDPQIVRLADYLKRPPFTAWNDFKLLDRRELSIQEGGPSEFPLPNGRTAELSFLGHTAGPGAHRLRLKLAMAEKDKSKKFMETTFVLDEGGVVLHVGQKFEGGVLILGVSCKTSN